MSRITISRGIIKAWRLTDRRRTTERCRPSAPAVTARWTPQLLPAGSVINPSSLRLSNGTERLPEEVRVPTLAHQLRLSRIPLHQARQFDFSPGSRFRGLPSERSVRSVRFCVRSDSGKRQMVVALLRAGRDHETDHQPSDRHHSTRAGPPLRDDPDAAERQLARQRAECA